MEEPKRELTRKELHELVWSTPIQKLAELYGLSDRGLSKICQRHLIPVPPRGYWAKVEAGQLVKRTPLRSVQNSMLEVVHIGARAVSKQSDYLAQVLAAAKTRVIDLGSDQPPLLHERTAPVRASVVTKPCSEVAPFLAELRSLQPDRDGFVYLRFVKVPPAAITRVGTFLTVLTDMLVPYGFALVDDKTTRLGFSKDGCTVDFGIDAPRKRVPSGPGSWALYDYVHAGRLEFTIFGSAKDVRKKWIDTDSHRIEDALHKIVDSFLINHVVEKEREAQRRADEARRATMARRRKLAALRATRETDRQAFFQNVAATRREVRDLQESIALIPRQAVLPADVCRMLQWAETRLEALEAQTTVDAIQATLADQNLFPEPDDLFDPLGDPPPKQNYWDD